MIYKGSISDFVPIVDFLADTFGSGIEFTLHDFSKPGETIIAIRNGQITGRKIGDSISNFTLRAMQESVKNDDDFAKLKSTVVKRKDLKTEDLLITGEDGEIKGLFCVNIPTQGMQEFAKLLDGIFGIHAVQKSNAAPSIEADTFQGLAESIIDGVIAEAAVPPERFSPEERIQVIERIYNKGVFQLKGVVGLVSKKLNVSEATIYRYLGSLS